VGDLCDLGRVARREAARGGGEQHTGECRLMRQRHVDVAARLSRGAEGQDCATADAVDVELADRVAGERGEPVAVDTEALGDGVEQGVVDPAPL
jgi:hypothetical protein